jgi:hypothetical protein
MKRIIGLVALTVAAAACGGGESTPVTVTPGSVPAGSSAEELAADDAPETGGREPGETSVAAADGEDRGCADVIDVEIGGDGPYTFAVTVSSPDTGWDKYADEWRIESVTGDVLGVRELTHPHVDEQPFTRSLSGVEVEAGTDVIVTARDSVEGYCGEPVSLTVGGRSP